MADTYKGERWLSPQQVSEILAERIQLRISRQTICSMITRGDLPFRYIRFGSRYKIDRDSVEEWLEEQFGEEA